MYITYGDLIQIGIFIVALVSLCYKLFKDRNEFRFAKLYAANASL